VIDPINSNYKSYKNLASFTLILKDPLPATERNMVSGSGIIWVHIIKYGENNVAYGILAVNVHELIKAPMGRRIAFLENHNMDYLYS
jgi:hypothetical protein